MNAHTPQGNQLCIPERTRKNANSISSDFADLHGTSFTILAAWRRSLLRGGLGIVLSLQLVVLQDIDHLPTPHALVQRYQAKTEGRATHQG